MRPLRGLQETRVATREESAFQPRARYEEYGGGGGEEQPEYPPQGFYPAAPERPYNCTHLTR